MLRESSTGDVMKRQVVFQLSAPPELSQTGEGSLEDGRVGLRAPPPPPPPHFLSAHFFLELLWVFRRLILCLYKAGD